MTDVPCEGCRICCISYAVRILPHEDASQWMTEPHFKDPAARQLAHKRNGECVYLGETGCTIHNAPRPEQCVAMDCRNVWRGVSYTQARKLRVLEIWKRGREMANETNN